MLRPTVIRKSLKDNGLGWGGGRICAGQVCVKSCVHYLRMVCVSFDFVTCNDVLGLIFFLAVNLL